MGCSSFLDAFIIFGTYIQSVGSFFGRGLAAVGRLESVLAGDVDLVACALLGEAACFYFFSIFGTIRFKYNI
jgi:hypothetical protein